MAARCLCAYGKCTIQHSLQRRVLRVIRIWPLCTNVEIAKHLDAKPSSVSSITKKLRTAGKIEAADFTVGPRGGMGFVIRKEQPNVE